MRARAAGAMRPLAAAVALGGLVALGACAYPTYGDYSPGGYAYGYPRSYYGYYGYYGYDPFYRGPFHRHRHRHDHDHDHGGDDKPDGGVAMPPPSSSPPASPPASPPPIQSPEDMLKRFRRHATNQPPAVAPPPAADPGRIFGDRRSTRTRPSQPPEIWPVPEPFKRKR